MDSLSSSLILLLVALVLLWLAVTDRLSRVLDAVDVLKGNATANQTTASAVTAAPVAAPVLHFPSLPKLGTNAQVPI